MLKQRYDTSSLHEGAKRKYLSMTSSIIPNGQGYNLLVELGDVNQFIDGGADLFERPHTLSAQESTFVFTLLFGNRLAIN